MRIQYVITETEMQRVLHRLSELRQIAMMSRDAGQSEDSREYYLRAKGFNEALKMLGVKDLL